MNLENLTEKEITHLKDMSKFCYSNESDFRTRVSIRILTHIQDKALNTNWDDSISVKEYKEYASKSLKFWFAYWDDERVLEEVNNIRTKNTININRLVKEMYYLNNVLNKELEQSSFYYKNSIEFLSIKKRGKKTMIKSELIKARCTSSEKQYIEKFMYKNK